LSNLIKSVYFNVDRQNKAVIDSNEAINNMPIFQQQNNLPEDFEFVPGINVLNIDDIIEEQKEAVNENAAGILEEARNNASQIIEEARREADSIREEARQNGYNQGYSEGIAGARSEIDATKMDYENKCIELQKQFDQLVEEAEPQIVDLVCDLVEKLTNIVVHGSTDAILYIIEKNLKELPPSEKYILHVSTDDLANIMEQKEELLQCVKPDVIFDIVEDVSLTLNQCLIETDTHILDCSLDVQLDNLRRELKLISSL
jgi:flagellar assembly protein FliH